MVNEAPIDRRITYGVLINSLRKYIEDEIDVTSLWRYPGFTAPSDYDYVAIQFVNNVFTGETKGDELINERVFFNLANFASDVVSLDKRQAKINEILMYHTIPILNYDGVDIGEFNVTGINGTRTITDGTEIESESTKIRSYTDFYVDVNHIKKRQ